MTPATSSEPGEAQGGGESGRGTDGRWTKGNRGHWKHGGTSLAVARGELPEQADALAVMAERQMAILNDLGGEDQVGQIKRDLISRYLQNSLIADYLADNIAREGVLSTKGRQRAAVNTFLAVVNTLHKLAGSIGLERRLKDLGDLSLSEYVARQERAESTVREAPQAASGATDDGNGSA